MKILHINTFDSGGAFNSCKRLHEALLRLGYESKVLVLYQQSASKEVYGYFHTYPRSGVQKWIDFFRLRWDTYQKSKILQKLKPHSEAFAFPQTPYSIEKHPFVKDADLIHLNWVSNFIDFQAFFSTIRKPILWTLRDLHPILGGFHYLTDLQQNPVLRPTNQKILEKKIRTISACKHLRLTVTSRWMQNQIQSSFLQKFPIHLIPNALDTQTFFPISDKVALKKEWGLPTDKKIILFVAELLHNRRKGLNLLIQALQMQMPSNSILVLVGKGRVNEMEHLPILQIDFVASEMKMNQLYNLADVVVATPLEEAFGNSLIEAAACGVPTVAFSVGGITDIIQESQTGFLVEPFDIKKLGEKICFLLENEEIHQIFVQNSRTYALEHFDIQQQVQAFLKIYYTLCPNFQNAPIKPN